MLVLGIDVGTQGARVVVCDAQGTVWAQAEESFQVVGVSKLPSGWAEQDPQTWWQALQLVLSKIVAQLRKRDIDLAAIEAMSITSTSGTILPIDRQGRPLHPALMYNDGRAQAEAELVQVAGQEQAKRLGYRFGPSFALAKILWLRRHEPDLFEKAYAFIHAADFIVGQLTGEFTTTDFSNALKTGYDLQAERWPDFIETAFEIPLDKLPTVVHPGQKIAVTAGAWTETSGLSAGIPVLAGMTDGCTSQISAGAVAPGEWNSTVGTTLVIKGVTEQLMLDPQGRIYSHRHPAGYWLPGGASNTGGEAMSQRFSKERWGELNAQVLKVAPTEVIRYPLARRGERFPFAHPQAEGFVVNPSDDEAIAYTAYLEGVGYVERLAYELLTDLGAVVGSTIYSAGGATRSRVWSQLRADILGRTLARPEFTGGAMGAAIIAAGGCWYEGVIPAAQSMVQLTERVEPRAEVVQAYEARYQHFREACEERGYI